MRVALVTCVDLPEPDPDEAPLLEALRAAGADAELLAWDGTRARPAEFDLCVLRSTWNYYLDLDGFLAWLDRAEAESRVLNPPAVVRGNVNKRYLAELNVPIVPTRFLARGESASIEWDDVVIKPAVSASSFRTRRFGPDDRGAAEDYLAELAAERDVMIQPYMHEVERSGERALVWIDGEVTHAVRKSPRFADGDEHVSQALVVSRDERRFAERALDGVARELLYARVDVVRDDAGELRLCELELAEPSLFLLQHPPAMERLVAAILRQ